MVEFPPLAPNVKWMSAFLKEYSDTGDILHAIEKTNQSLENNRDFGRYRIQNSNKEEINLSLAVEGGARQLRNRGDLCNLRLSEHGDWRKNHLGALEANLGKKPFFRDLSPRLISIYRDRNLTTLQEFNSAIFDYLLSFLLGKMNSQDLSLFNSSAVLKQRGMEIAKKMDGEISSIQVIANLGKESLLGFLAYEL